MIQQFQISFIKFKRMTKKSNNRWLWFVAVIIIWIGSYFAIYQLYGKADGPGTFGDQFGAINALFTGLSLAGIIITLIQQQEELTAQRREFMTSRAMTIVYKQVEMVANVVHNAYYLKVNLSQKALERWGVTKEPNLEISGIYAVNNWNDLISRSENKNEIINELKGNMNHLLNSLSNSVELLIKTQRNENMTDDDALFVFESFKYNIDHRVWTFIETLREVNWDDSEKELEDIKNDVEKICAFLDEIESLKNNTNSSK